MRARTTELEATNARLAELDELRRRLVHSASHELRNALVAICWFSDSLAGRLGDNIDKEQAEQIRRSAARISAVVDDLVASADLEQEQIHLRREEVDVAALVSDSLAAYGAAADAKLVALSASEPGPLVVDGDRVRLAQVLDNLVANAIKYTGAGGRVEVAAGVAQDDVVLRVADDGIGIGGEDKERVFDPFFRAQAARATAPGSGLGLHVSRTIVAAHGGSLTVRDTPGGGATFELRLPRRSRVRPAARPRACDRLAAAAGAPRAQRAGGPA